MKITDKIRKAFDDCTVMAGVENDFECVYITKAAALLYLNEIDADYDMLRELCKELLGLCYDAYEQKWGWDDDWALAYEQAKKLGVEVSA